MVVFHLLAPNNENIDKVFELFFKIFVGAVRIQRHCQGKCGCGQCLGDHNGNASGQVPTRSTLYARPRSEVARQTRRHPMSRAGP